MTKNIITKETKHMSKSRTVKFPDSRMAVVVEESAVAILEPIPADEIVAEQQATAPVILAPEPGESERLTLARQARAELIALHRTAKEVASSAASAVESAKVAASEIAGADEFDQSAYVIASTVVTEKEAVLAGRVARADAIANRGVAAEKELEVALAEHRAANLAVEVAQYNRAVADCGDRYVQAIREAWTALGGVATTDALSWVSGGIARSLYLQKMTAFQSQAKSLLNRGANVNEPYIVGSGYANYMLQHGDLPEAVFVEALVDVNP